MIGRFLYLSYILYYLRYYIDKIYFQPLALTAKYADYTER